MVGGLVRLLLTVGCARSPTLTMLFLTCALRRQYAYRRAAVRVGSALPGPALPRDCCRGAARGIAFDVENAVVARGEPRTRVVIPGARCCPRDAAIDRQVFARVRVQSRLLLFEQLAVAEASPNATAIVYGASLCVHGEGGEQSESTSACVCVCLLVG